MTQLISFIAIAVGLGVSLASLALRKRVEGGSDAMLRAKQALSSLQAGLLPAEMVARIFDRTDLVYVESQASEDIREMFMSERKLVVLSWIRRVRQEVNDLRSFHLGSARFYAGLSLATEAFKCLRVLRDIFGKKFEGDKSTERHVLGLIHNTHTTAAQLLDDEVVRNGLADHLSWTSPAGNEHVRSWPGASQRRRSPTVCASFLPKVHGGTQTAGARSARWRIETASCAVHAEGHSNATVRWSEHRSPLSGSLN